MLVDWRTSVLADLPKAMWMLDLAHIGPTLTLPHDLTGHGFDVTSSNGNPSTNIAYPLNFVHSETGGVRYTNSEFLAPVVPTPGDWTVEFWHAGGSVSSGSYTLWYNGHWTGASGGDGYGMAVTPINTLTVVANGFNTSISPAHGFAQGSQQWNQFVVGYNSTTHGVFVWVNGVPDAGNPYAFASLPVPPTTNMFLGKNQGVSFAGTTGTGALYAIWSSLLTTAQVLAHYNALWSFPDADYPFSSILHPGGGTEQPSVGRIKVL